MKPADLFATGTCNALRDIAQRLPAEQAQRLLALQNQLCAPEILNTTHEHRIHTLEKRIRELEEALPAHLLREETVLMPASGTDCPACGTAPYPG